MNFKNEIKRNSGYLAILFVSLAYVLTALITIEQTGKSVYQIIADGMLAFLFGFSIDKMFELQGMKDGENDLRVMRTMALHESVVLAIIPYLEYLDGWCDLRNAENYKLQRSKILSKGGIHYRDAFDEDGVALGIDVDPKRAKSKEQKRNDKIKLKAYSKARDLKLAELTPTELTGNGRTRSEDIYDFGRTKIEYEKSVSRKQAISKIFTAVFFGYYGVTLIKNFSWEVLIWNILQVAIFLVMGVVKMYQAYNYITDEYRTATVKKIDLLQKYQNYVKINHPEHYIDTEQEKSKIETKENEVE